MAAALVLPETAAEPDATEGTGARTVARSDGLTVVPGPNGVAMADALLVDLTTVRVNALALWDGVRRKPPDRLSPFSVAKVPVSLAPVTIV